MWPPFPRALVGRIQRQSLILGLRWLQGLKRQWLKKSRNISDLDNNSTEEAPGMKIAKHFQVFTTSSRWLGCETLKLWAHYTTCKDIRSLDCSHHTTVCLVSGLVQSLMFSHYMTDHWRGGTHYKICSLGGAFGMRSPSQSVELNVVTPS